MIIFRFITFACIAISLLSLLPLIWSHYTDKKNNIYFNECHGNGDIRGMKKSLIISKRLLTLAKWNGWISTKVLILLLASQTAEIILFFYYT